MGLSNLRSPSRQRHKRCDKYQESRAIPAEMDKNYPVGRRESHAYEKSATALSVGIPRHNATAFGGGRMSTLPATKLTLLWQLMARRRRWLISVLIDGQISTLSRQFQANTSIN